MVTTDPLVCRAKPTDWMCDTVCAVRACIDAGRRAAGKRQAHRVHVDPHQLCHLAAVQRWREAGCATKTSRLLAARGAHLTNSGGAAHYHTASHAVVVEHALGCARGVHRLCAQEDVQSAQAVVVAPAMRRSRSPASMRPVLTVMGRPERKMRTIFCEGCTRRQASRAPPALF